MQLRVTRPAYINAMVQRGYKADESFGLKASQNEMRNHVCQQCHVEYYFRGKDKLLTYPWTEWPKNRPLKFEMIEAYYDRTQKDGSFKADWRHKTTGAPMIKIQHPEAELTSSGRHTRIGVTCADCHMPKVKMGSDLLTDHNLDSPLNDLNSCSSCHKKESAAQLRKMVSDVQRHTYSELSKAEYAILALIGDIKEVREGLENDHGLNPDEIDKVLNKVLDGHRRASMRWDFVGAENSAGMHSPREAWRILKDAQQIARKSQKQLKKIADDRGVELVLTGQGAIPAAPEQIHPGNIVGSMPPDMTIGALVLMAYDQYFGSKRALAWHQSMGMLVFFLYFGRIVLMAWFGKPEALGTRFEKFLAHMAHLALYSILLLMPLTGLLANLARSRDTDFFGLFTIAGFDQRNMQLYQMAIDAHSWLEIVCYLLLAAHVGAALWHHFVLKDDTMKRMW